MNRSAVLLGFITAVILIISGIVIFRNDNPPLENGGQVGIGGAPPETAENRDVEIERNIVQELESRGNFTIFLESLRSLGMLEKMSGPERFTVFAAPDEAFVNVRSDLLYPIVTSRESLRRLINTHIVRGELANDELNEGDLVNLNGEQLNFSDRKIENVDISDGNIQVTNGIIHIINGVIFPENMIQTITPTGSFTQ